MPLGTVRLRSPQAAATTVGKQLCVSMPPLPPGAWRSTYDDFRMDFNKSLPLAVRRYFWVGLLGESGWVMTTKPAPNAGCK